MNKHNEEYVAERKLRCVGAPLDGTNIDRDGITTVVFAKSAIYVPDAAMVFRGSDPGADWKIKRRDYKWHNGAITDAEFGKVQKSSLEPGYEIERPMVEGKFAAMSQCDLVNMNPLPGRVHRLF